MIGPKVVSAQSAPAHSLSARSAIGGFSEDLKKVTKIATTTSLTIALSCSLELNCEGRTESDKIGPKAHIARLSFKRPISVPPSRL